MMSRWTRRASPCCYGKETRGCVRGGGEVSSFENDEDLDEDSRRKKRAADENDQAHDVGESKFHFPEKTKSPPKIFRGVVKHRARILV